MAKNGFNAKFAILVNQNHDDIIEWKHFPRYWPFVRGIHRSPVNSPHKGQWREALVFSSICAWINSWVNNREVGYLRCQHAHYDVTVMTLVMSNQYPWCLRYIHTEPACWLIRPSWPNDFSWCLSLNMVYSCSDYYAMYTNWNVSEYVSKIYSTWELYKHQKRRYCMCIGTNYVTFVDVIHQRSHLEFKRILLPPV